MPLDLANQAEKQVSASAQEPGIPEELSFSQTSETSRLIDSKRSINSVAPLKSSLKQDKNGNQLSSFARTKTENLKIKTLKQKLLEISEEIKQDQEQQPSKNKLQLDSLKAGFQRIIEKKTDDEEYKQNQYFQQIFDETKQNYLKKKTNEISLRQLAHQKLGIKLRRQQNNLIREVEKFKLEDRAESNIFYNLCFKLVNKRFFTKVISFFIVLNTVDLALDRYPIAKSESVVLDDVNIAFSMIFLLEMIIRISAFGFKNYFKDPFNIFDCVVVLSSLIDLIVSFSIQSESGGAITALRAFRLIRVFKLAKSWKRFQNLLKTIGRTLKDISTFSILLFLFMFIYTLLGMEVFAFKAQVQDDDMTLDPVNGHSPKANFDSFVSSFTTVFIILTNDGWASIYYNYYRTVGSLSSTIFFVSLILVGQKILLNLFLAILLENFDEESLNEELKQKRKSKKYTIWLRIKGAASAYFSQFRFCRRLCNIKRRNRSSHMSQHFVEVQNVDDSASDSLSSMSRKTFNSHNKSTFRKQLEDSSNSASRLNSGSSALQSATLQRRNATHQFNKTNQSSSVDEPQMYGKSLNLFSQTNKFREFCFKMVMNTKFDVFIIFIIAVSSVQLAIENPLNDPNSSLESALFYIDMATTIIFSLEAVAKIIAFGFIMNRKFSYLRNGWNAMDFAIVIMSIVSLTPLVNDLNIFKIFRVVRILRLISRNEGLQLAVKALIQALPQAANVAIIMLLFFLIFGIIGISYFKGKYFYCYNDYIAFTYQQRLLNKWDCASLGGNWQNRPWSFDDIFSAMKTLFQMATTSGWSDIMFASINTSEIDSAPIKNNNIYWIIFFIIFIIVGSFFLLNLFVGVVISTFNREKDQIGGNNLLTERQKNWIDTKLIALRAKPKKLLRKPENIIRKVCYIIQAHSQFQNAVLCCIIMNTLVLMLKWFDQPQSMQYASDIINQVFTSVFALEAVIKIIGTGRAYFQDNWNIFDFVVVLGSIASIFLTISTSFSLGGATTIIRAFRITRIFRLVKRAKNLRLVFNTFIFTLPALANVGGLLLLLLYFYSIIGVYLFAEVKRSGVLADNLNFESFFSAFITLFVISTGDAWDQIVAATLQRKAVDFDCIYYSSYQDYKDNGYQTIGCGDNTGAGLVFYYSYIVFVNLIFLNLFIAIILQGFDDTQLKDSRLFNQETLSKFRDVWAQYDPDATTYIPISKLKDFLFDLGLPLGWDEQYIEKISLQEQFIVSLDLPIYRNFSDYMFMDVLEALALRLVVQEQLNLERERKRRERDQKDSLLDESHNPDYERERSNPEDQQSEWHHSRVEEDDEGSRLKHEERIKDSIKQDINKLEFQESISKIRAVKEVVKDSMKAQARKKDREQDSHFTSLHQAAAHVAIQHMKYIVAKRKLIKHINEIQEANEQEESDLIIKDKKQSIHNSQVEAAQNSRHQSLKKIQSTSIDDMIQPQSKPATAKTENQQQQTRNSSRVMVSKSNQIVIIPGNSSQQTIVNINVIENSRDSYHQNYEGIQKSFAENHRRVNLDVSADCIGLDIGGNQKIKFTSLASPWIQNANQQEQDQAKLKGSNQNTPQIVQKFYQSVNINTNKLNKYIHYSNSNGGDQIHFNQSNPNDTNFPSQAMKQEDLKTEDDEEEEKQEIEVLKEDACDVNNSQNSYILQKNQNQESLQKIRLQSARVEDKLRNSNQSIKLVKSRKTKNKKKRSSRIQQQQLPNIQNQGARGNLDVSSLVYKDSESPEHRELQLTDAGSKNDSVEKTNQNDFSMINLHYQMEQERISMNLLKQVDEQLGEDYQFQTSNKGIKEEINFQNKVADLIHSDRDDQGMEFWAGSDIYQLNNLKDILSPKKVVNRNYHKMNTFGGFNQVLTPKEQSIMSLYQQIKSENEEQIFSNTGSSGEQKVARNDQSQANNFNNASPEHLQSKAASILSKQRKASNPLLNSGTLGSYLKQIPSTNWRASNYSKSKNKQSFNAIKVVDDERAGIDEDQGN